MRDKEPGVGQRYQSDQYHVRDEGVAGLAIPSFFEIKESA
jgi:hypothetical protein